MFEKCQLARKAFLLNILLDNGYSRKASLNLLTGDLPDNDGCRNILYRCVHPSSTHNLLKEKTVFELNGKSLGIDLLNVLSTLYGIKAGSPVFMCNDGFIRDILSTRVKIRDLEKSIITVLPELVKLLEELNVTETVFVIDKQIPWSRNLASLIQNTYSPPSITIRVEKADSTLIELGENGYVIASSDTIILERARQITDLIYMYLEKHGLLDYFLNTCNVRRLIELEKERICREIDL